MYNVMIIENDPVEVFVLESRLRDTFNLAIANSIAEAKTKVPENQDAIILDIGIPDTTKERIIEDVKKISSAAIIVLSDYDEPEFIKKTIRQNASNYLVKGKDDGDANCLACHIRTAIKLNQAMQMGSEIKQRSNIPMFAGFAFACCLVAASLMAASVLPDDVAQLLAIDSWINGIANR